MSAYKTLAEACQEYRQLCYDDDLPPVQESETKQAFYSGSFVILVTLLRMADRLTFDEAEQMIQVLFKEADDYCRSRLAKPVTNSTIKP